jgi:Glycosyl hydrolase family 115/Gylcosyl hydrolase family 115 C-terminal domain
VKWLLIYNGSGTRIPSRGREDMRVAEAVCSSTRRLGACLLTFALAASAAHAQSSDCGAATSICTHAVEHGVALIDGASAAEIVVDAHDFQGVVRAARNVRSDLDHVSGGARTTHRSLVIAGTIGHSAVIDRLVKASKVDVTGVRGRWEAFAYQTVDNPMPGVDHALVIAGADKRGTIFGLYELSARLGVSPWTWWADVPVRTRSTAYVVPGRFLDEPSVRYRGIFLNDEDPALLGWVNQTFGGFNHTFYEHVFDLILRLKGNFLWPAMWGKAIYDDDPVSPQLADEMGVVLGTSHHEPMMRAHVEWMRHGAGDWDYTTNAERLRAFWRTGIERMKSNESLVTIGMRGDGDKPMTQGTAIGLLEKIVADQRKIIEEVTHKPAQDTPQVWALYKEVQDYYDQGMTVPDDVTLLFSDDNWGNLRRLPKPGQQRAGGYGVYYHFDYVGGPRSYKWLNTNQIERTWEQMRRAYDAGADRLWIVNVGDLKPMEFPISFFLDYAWGARSWPVERVTNYPRAWAAQQFGDVHAQEIGELLTGYTQINARRKPELLAADTYSLANFREAERAASQYNALASRAIALGNELPTRYRDAYFELVSFPIQICANLTDMYVSLGLDRKYAAEGRVAANAYADRVEKLFARDAELTRQYHQTLAHGRWNHMMSQTHISYTGWHDPQVDVMPQVRRIRPQEQATMGVDAEGDLRLTPYGAASRYIEIYNRGKASFGFTAQTPESWLHLSTAAGTVTDQARIELSVDWSHVPSGEHEVPVTISGAASKVTVMAHVSRPEITLPRDVPERTFVEGDGYVAIEASHYAHAVNSPSLVWQEIPNLGRTLSAVTTFARTAPAAGASASQPHSPAHLEYNVFLLRPGAITVQVTCAPSLDFSGGKGLRYEVSVDGGPPSQVNMNAERPGNAWADWVSNNANIQEASFHVATPGLHVIKLWASDPAVVFERLVIAQGALPASYLGPAESLDVEEARSGRAAGM